MIEAIEGSGMSDSACREGQSHLLRRLNACIRFSACVVLLGTIAGCTSRGMTVTSLPPGAEVSINRRVVGKTPVRVNYTHYGSYRVELRKERYQPRIVTEKVKPPAYGYDPIAFVADNVLPARINDEVSLHYVLQPVKEADQDALLSRAALAREGKVTHPFTQEPVEIVMEMEPAVPDEPIEDLVPGEEGPKSVPDLTVPKEKPSETSPTIKEKPPEGPTLSKELGIKTKEEKKTKAKKTEKRPKRMRRTPKGEILIYEDEPIEDPDKKK